MGASLTKKYISIVFILVLPGFGSSVLSQGVDYERSVVKSLSSNEYYGRAYVNEGDKKAANFIAQEFEKIGILKIKNSYKQSFKIDVNTFPGEMLLIVNGDTMIPGKDYIVDPASPRGMGGGKVGYLKANDVYRAVAQNIGLSILEGDILVIDERESNFSKEESQLYAMALNSLKQTKELNLGAIVILTNKKLTWHVSQHQITRPLFYLKTSMDLSKENEIGFSLDAELVSNYKTSNVLGVVEGKERPDSFIVLTAHYDHLGTMGHQTFFPGANDNASGVSMLLGLAKYFNSNPINYSIVFLATGAEELGLLGAKHFTSNPPIKLDKIKFLINFDLAGTGDDGITVVNGSVFKEEFERLQELNKTKSYLPDVKSRGEACNSDHCMFFRVGVPSFYIYTLGGIQAYHDVYDCYETLSFTGFLAYKNLLVDFINGF